jgi:hypothetical protein
MSDREFDVWGFIKDKIRVGGLWDYCFKAVGKSDGGDFTKD